MNHSIHSADRATHLKIVAVALVAGLAIAGFGISARSTSDYAQTAHVVKAGKAMAVTRLGRGNGPIRPFSIFDGTKRPPAGGLCFWGICPMGSDVVAAAGLTNK